MHSLRTSHPVTDVMTIFEFLFYQAFHVGFQAKWDVKVFIHNPGEEFWLSGSAVFPTEVSSLSLDIANDAGVVGAGFFI